MIDLREIQGAGVRQLAGEAASFLAGRAWCGEVTGGQLGFAVSNVIGVFLLRLVPTRPEVDDIVWVVVGDVPPAYIVCDDAPDWQAALARYAEEMRRWIDAVRSHGEVDRVIPVSAPPTLEYAEQLERRIDFIERELVNVPSDDVVSDI